MTEPMSTPDSGGLREAVEALADAWNDEEIPWLPGKREAADLRALLAAHPEPVPTPDSAEPVERACDSDFGYPGTSVHRAHEWDAEVQERAGARWTSETFRCPGVASDSADDATVDEREYEWVRRGPFKPTRRPATPPAVDANRAAVSGGLGEGEREALAEDEITAAEAERDTARRETGEAGAKAVRDAADEVHRESRWSLEQAMQGKPQDAVDRLLVLERVLRARADAPTSDDGSGA